MMEQGQKELAVQVRGAYKRYSPQAVILRGLNMSVREGTIYALLGPSGCGKTTLLRCVIGRDILDAGEILVKAKRLRYVGYMPQDIALHSNMSIAETFNFYGLVFELNWKQIHTRREELLRFLALPSGNRLITELSGGQQRRVSLAVTLLHDPQLLILDEPTVGVDPVLSHSIWQRLLEMAELHKKTIIITTHYIEESKQAHTIGLMRHGVLLAEESPLDLMYHQNCDSLEEAFLKLSQKQKDASEIPQTAYPVQQTVCRHPLNNRSIWCTRRFIAQLQKNLVFHFRNIPMLCFLMLLPVLQTYLTCTVLQEPDVVPFAVVSLELPNGFADCDVNTSLVCSEHGRPLSCKYLDHFRERPVELTSFPNLDEGVEAVRKNQAYGVLFFSENYTSSILDRITLGRNADDSSIDGANIDVRLDMSAVWISLMLKRDIFNSFIDYLKDLFAECGNNPQAAEIPVRFADPIFGLRSPSFIHYAVQGEVITFGFFLPLMFTTGAIMMEKKDGLLERSLSAGLSIFEIIAAHTVVQFVIISVQNLVMMFVFYVIYYNPLYGSLPLLLVLVYLVEAAGVAFAFLLGIFFDSEKLAAYFGTGTVIAMYLFCGVGWPYQGMHWTLRYIIWMFPMQPAVESYRGIAERSWGLDHHVVYQGFISTVVWIFIFALAAYYFARKKKIGL